MRKDKILFVFKRCEHKNNKILILKNLSFLSITLFIFITRSLKSIIKNKLNENSFNMNFLKDTKKNQHRLLKNLRKR